MCRSCSSAPYVRVLAFEMPLADRVTAPRIDLPLPEPLATAHRNRHGHDLQVAEFPGVAPLAPVPARPLDLAHGVDTLMGGRAVRQVGYRDDDTQRLLRCDWDLFVAWPADRSHLDRQPHRVPLRRISRLAR